MKARNPSTGNLETVYVKALDSMPVGTIVDYDGDTIPTGWEEVNEWKYLGATTRQTYIGLPNKWNELRCVVLFNGDANQTGVTTILKQYLEAPIGATNFGVTCIANTGTAGNAQVWAGNINILNNQIRITYVPGATSASKLYVYYK